MTTQTLRGMLEPLHWRGDRGTMNAFNAAFVGLMGTEDIGPIDGKPAGLPPDTMELFRQFALDIEFPPNPYRLIDDTVPDHDVAIPGHQQPGNPTAGEALFLNGSTDAGQACVSCHTLPFGAAEGKLGGVEPGDPSSARAALFNGTADGSPHSDLKVPHLRNLYEKFGPRFGSHTDPGDPIADQKSGFGFIHDGSIPDLGTFLSASVFTLTAQQVRDINMFQLHFPTRMKPSVGAHLTVPPGAASDPVSPDEQLLSVLIGLGNMADPDHHCELTASALEAGSVRRGYTLDGGLGTGGLWTTDVGGEAQVTTASLRLAATSPISFLCATPGSGVRLGIDRDLDGFLNGSDCSDGDPGFHAAPQAVTGLAASDSPPLLTWDDQSPSVGSGVFYEVAGGTLGGLTADGLEPSTACLDGALADPFYDDPRSDPPVGDGHYYVVRARTPECSGGFGAARASIEPLDCTGL